jgi:hypothetical protein
MSKKFLRIFFCAFSVIGSECLVNHKFLDFTILIILRDMYKPLVPSNVIR